jgi:ketose-bisphosphate aldolase
MWPAGLRSPSEGQHNCVSMGEVELRSTESGNLVGLVPMLERAQGSHYAVGAFNCCNCETVQAIIEEACLRRSPVILIIGPWELPLVGARMIAEMTRYVAADADVPVCLHLDHAPDYDLVQECIECGFPSVMLDGSALDLEANVALTRRVVDLAHPRGITVEGELGAIGRVGESSPEGGAGGALTSPDQAAEFVQRTGVDALAVAIGNAHGMYTQLPVLDFERLQAIRDVVPVPLVLHGGSGTSVEQLQRSVAIGISKVNVASEIACAYLDALQTETMKKNGRDWYAKALVDSKAAIRDVIGRWMVMLGCAGQAP